MSDYPDPDEEFELLYGDELELLREQDEELHPPSKSRKSLDFSTASTSKDISIPQSRTSQSLDNYFDNDFPGLSSATNILESSAYNSGTSCLQSIVSSSQNVEQMNEADSSDSRKRTVDDLFGDINDLGDDILWEYEQISKKPKLSEKEELLVLMKQIIGLRKLNKEKHNSLSGQERSTTYSSIQHSKQNLSYHVPKYPFIGVKRQDGERIYVRFHSEEYEKEERHTIVNTCSSKGLFGDSYREIWKDAKALITKQNALAEEDIDEVTELSLDTKNDENKQLWTDMYKPRKYIELLSDESTNRIMLKWLKLWDKAVFNRKPKVKLIKPGPEKNKHWFFKEKELDTNLDEHGRPQHKVVLLCGPPGLGKTTLAHVAAKHAGYNVVEINASDDRSTEAFKTSLENATQMRSVCDREGRPNCLVFDEIDGAPQASIDFLIKFINGNASTKSKKGKGQKQAVLKRPIICICNDVYVPALRPLRQIAFVINFPPISSVRLSERLMCISRRECIKTDMGAMMALAEKSNNDIRSCLSVLHFFKTNKKPVTLSDIYKTSIGQKDMQKGLFTVWQEIFQIERPKIKSAADLNISNKHTLRVRMSKILQTVQSFGDYDRLSQGVFENFPKLILKDSSMQGLSRAAEWFVFSDLLNKQIYSLQNYSLSTYLPYAFVIWHFTFAVPQSQKLNYPNLGYEAKQKETCQKAVISEVLRGMPPYIRAYCQRLSLILDILPLLSRIIVPPFRMVSLHLYSKEEKQNMSRVVNTMIDYNLNYIQERLPDGVYVYNLEPNIDDIVYLDKTSQTRISLSYANKQMVSREIDLEKMRRFEVSRGATETSKKNSSVKENASPKTPLPNHMQKLNARTVNTKPTIRKDFFGRSITSPTTSSVQGQTRTNLNNDIWYQYKEGYNNAVRKTIKIGTLK